MASLEDELDRLAATTAFTGVVRVDRADELVFEKAYGFAHRALQVSNSVDTQFAIASAVKGMTAIAVVSLIVDGALELSTPARAVLGSDLPLIADDVTIEHLLAHRSGIGDYLDEEVDRDQRLRDAGLGHRLATTEQFLPVLDGHPTKFAAGSEFTYCNGGFVVLALIAERVSGVPFHDLVEQRVCRRRGWSTPHSSGRTTSRARPRSATCTSTASCAATSSISPFAATATAGSTRPPPTSRCCGGRSSPTSWSRRNGLPR